MKLESAAVNTGEEVPAQPRNQDCQRSETSHEERDQERAPVMEADLQEAAIAATKSLEGCLKAFLKSHQRIAAGRISGLLFLAPQQILGHGRNDGSRKEIRGQHGEHYRLGERHKQVSRHAGKQEHRSKHNADRERGDECGCRDLRRTVENDFVHVLLGLCLAIAIDVLDLDRGVVHQNADRQSEPPERHDIDRLPDRTERNDRGQDRQRDRGRNDHGASPTAQECENHESGQASGNQCFPDHSTDRAANKNRLVRQRSHLQLRWNRCRNLRQKAP